MPEPVRRIFERLWATDVESADDGALRQVVADGRRIRAWLDAVDVAVARRSAALASGATTASVTETLSDGGRRSAKDARAAAERAAVCERMNGVEDALRTGTITAGHVDAIANASRQLDEAAKSALAGFTEALIGAAATKPIGAFEREVRDLVRQLSSDDGEERLDRQRRDRSVRQWIDKTSGMHHLHAVLDPESGQKLFTAIDAQLATVMQREGNAKEPLERLRADALVELATSTAVGERRVPEISILIDWQTLVDGLHDNSLCETAGGVPLPVATVRRLCCEADVLPIVLGGDGEPLDCGRDRRTANRAQRRALAALYRTCGHPECDVSFDHCRIHHVIPWERLGPTDWVNLIPLCDRHHRLVHEGRWHLAMSPDHVITLCRPDGTLVFEGRTCDRWPPPSFVREATPPDGRSRQRTGGAPTGSGPPRKAA